MLRAVRDLLFPPACLQCGKRLPDSRLPLFCSTCMDDVNVIGSPACTCCGLPFPVGSDHLCGDCVRRFYHFELARSAFVYSPPVSRLIVELKFGARLHGLASLACLARINGHFEPFSPPDFIVPVPLHRRRLQQRGFNQATLIARSCFPGWEDRIAPGMLIRVRDTVSQSSLTGLQRRRSLRNAFRVSSTQSVEQRRILLVDDVFTTGSTVNECAKKLTRAGASKVEVFTLARAL